MAKYRVKPGRQHGASGEYGPGDTVIMTEAEAKGFLDKLEFVREVDVPTKPPTEIEKKLGKTLGSKLADKLVRAGFKTILDLQTTEPGKLASIPGVGDSSVKKILEAIK